MQGLNPHVQGPKARTEPSEKDGPQCRESQYTLYSTKDLAGVQEASDGVSWSTTNDMRVWQWCGCLARIYGKKTD